jgi:hypothetical protein
MRGQAVAFRVALAAWTTDTPGIVVHLGIGSHHKMWEVAHLYSGKRMATFPTRAQCEEFARRLGNGKRPVDWTGDVRGTMEPQKWKKLVKAIHKLVDQMGGVK